MRILLFGTFDSLHPGHTFVLQEASKRGDVFVVVARDETVERIKKRAPEQPLDERMRAIQEAFPEVNVLPGDTKDYLAPVRNIQPDLILLGYDQTLPPGVHPEDLPCPVERLPSFEPHLYKSSLRRSEKEGL